MNLRVPVSVLTWSVSSGKPCRAHQNIGIFFRCRVCPTRRSARGDCHRLALSCCPIETVLVVLDRCCCRFRGATALDISEETVFRAKRRYAEEGLDEVMRHRIQVNRYQKVDDRVEAHLDSFGL